MIKIEHTEVFGWEAAIRGMRNPMNSWDKSDSIFTCSKCEGCYYENEATVEVEETEESIDTVSWCNHTCLKLGENDLKVMKSLSKAGDDHGKFLRMINVTVDITAPLYWWKEFDTYKVGTVANSCSTMHKIHAKEFELDDFSHEHLTKGAITDVLEPIVSVLNHAREAYINYEEFTEKDPDGWEDGITCKKDLWWQMIQMLPSSYNQRRTVQLNYQVLKNMYFARRHHKLDEWHDFCAWCESLPYFKELCIQE